MSIAAPPSEPSSIDLIKQAVGVLWKRPAFVVTFVILSVAAVGLNGATSYLKLHFRKLPVALQQDLKQLPKHLGPWTQVSLDMPLSPDIQHVLGTEKYIFRDFVDTSKVPASRMAEFEGKDYNERRRLVGMIQSQYPDAVLFLSVTYYTGLVDTVAHIPDRCFIADGFQPTDYNFPKWKLAGSPVDEKGWRLDESGKRVSDPTDSAAHADAGLSVRFINFEDQDTRTRKSTRNVTYFFQVNGRYDANPLGVRTSLQDLFQKHGYYAKVELMTLLPDPQKSWAVKTNFLENALPELEKCLPNWRKTVLSGPDASAESAPAVPTTAPTTPPGPG